MSTTSPPPEGPGGPEYLEQGGGDPVPPAASGGSGRRTALIAGGAVVLLAAAGAGTWAAMSFLGSGAEPTEALPSGTLAYASVDLDPSGSQKIEAFRMLEKFPAIKEELGGFDAQDDIRRKIFEEADCEGLDYDDDIAPWIGTTFAVAAVDAGEKQPSPVGVLEVTDAGAAEAGLADARRLRGRGRHGGRRRRRRLGHRRRDRGDRPAGRRRHGRRHPRRRQHLPGVDRPGRRPRGGQHVRLARRGPRPRRADGQRVRFQRGLHELQRHRGRRGRAHYRDARRPRSPRSSSRRSRTSRVRPPRSGSPTGVSRSRWPPTSRRRR